VLRKRSVDVSVEALEAPGPDPREYVAVRHNLRQAQREIEAAQEAARQQQQAAADAAAHERAATLDEVRRTYEQSLSWRLTRPLRSAARAVRAYRSGRPR
jgi:hypothetical protein